MSPFAQSPIPPPPVPPEPGPSTYQWVLGWILAIILLAFAYQTNLGHMIIYYGLVLVLVLLLVTQYKFIAQALAPVGQSAPS